MNGARYALSTVALARVRASAAALSVISGGATLGDVSVGGGLGGGTPSGISGDANLGGPSLSGGMASSLRTVTTPPLSRNPGAGARWAGVTGIAMVVLSDDGTFTRLASGTVAQAGDGTVQLPGAVPGSVGDNVLVLLRFATGELGIERCTLS